MKKIALLTVHGMGDTEKNYADDFKQKLQSKLLPNEWDQVSFQPVYYQDLLQTPQTELFERTRTQAQYPHPQRLMMVCKDRVAEVIKVSAARFALIALTMGLGLIFTPFDHDWAITLGTAHP